MVNYTAALNCAMRYHLHTLMILLAVALFLWNSGCDKPRELDVDIRRTSVADSHVMLLLYKKRVVAGFWANPSHGAAVGIYNKKQCGAAFIFPDDPNIAWDSTVVDGKVTSLMIGNEPYSIANGNFFLITRRDGMTTIEQLSIDLATEIPTPDELGNAELNRVLTAIAMKHPKLTPLVILCDTVR